MASTASDLIKFEKMATGEKSGTWGTLANQAMSRIEEAIAEITNITLAGSNYTLDDTQYLEHADSTPAQESHVAMIKATGTPGATRQVIVPLRNKQYIVWNATTDASDLTVGGASGATVTVSNGYMARVFCDGTNVEFGGPLVTVAGVVSSSALPAASLTVVGGIEVATVAETNTGSDATRAVSPDGLDGWTGSAQIATVGTITSGAWTGTDVAVAAGGTGASSASAAATNLGLGTGDSPEFTAVNVGASTDTTVTRVSAGVIAVEGDTVPMLATAQTFSKAQSGSITALSDGANISVDLALNNHFSVTLAGNRTLDNPTNIVAGQSGSIFITQDGSGSRTLAYGSYYDFAAGTAPTLTTTAAKIDRIDYIARTTTSLHCVFTGDLS